MEKQKDVYVYTCIYYIDIYIYTESNTMKNHMFQQKNIRVETSVGLEKHLRMFVTLRICKTGPSQWMFDPTLGDNKNIHRLTY